MLMLSVVLLLLFMYTNVSFEENSLVIVNTELGLVLGKNVCKLACFSF